MVIAGKEQYPCPCSFTVPRQIKQKRQTFNYFWNWTSCYWYMFFIYMQKLIALYYYRINECMVITCVVSIIVFTIVDNNCSIDYLKMMIQLCYYLLQLRVVSHHPTRATIWKNLRRKLSSFAAEMDFSLNKQRIWLSLFALWGLSAFVIRLFS